MLSINIYAIIIVVLLMYFFICIFKNISSKIPFIIGIIFIIVSAGFMLLENYNMANIIALIAYCLFIITIALILIDNLKNIRKKYKTRYCPYCKTELESNFKFCSECGKRTNFQIINKSKFSKIK